MVNGWSQVEIAGKPADAFAFDRPARFGLLFLHDRDGSSPTQDAVPATLLAQHAMACLAPHGGDCWWVDRIGSGFDPLRTPERHLLDHVVPWMEAHGKLAPRALAVAGIGMGGQAALRLGFRYPQRFPIVAGMDGALDFHEWHGRGTTLDSLYETREHARQDTAILHVEPAHWPTHIWFSCRPGSEWYRGNDRLAEKLRAYGISHTADLNTQLPVEARLTSMFQFLANSLERESRRLM